MLLAKTFGLRVPFLESKTVSTSTISPCVLLFVLLSLSCRSQITTTQFCVIPIEDENNTIELLSNRTPLPPTSSVRKPTPNTLYEIDEDSIPLPGTPSDIDEGSIRLKLCSSGSSNPLNTTVTVHLAGEGGLQPSRSLDSVHSGSDSISPRSSSVGSNHSVKSTDMLLPGGEKKTTRGDLKKH